ncbi:abietadienol/abietadienal oxidase isoform X2 [Jatropha curcas]|uniref:abietadienol/abietadienal oxidase isoform X2 n=1 Tax=Jatropha curcas TaxID=180498 RepID=UPI0009D6E628|nr:abietadienol/abietadienal oxidase isoform X2 [Jatropha curcas]
MWEFLLPSLLCIILVFKFFGSNNKKKSKLPPGRRSWPLIGDSFNWYKAVSGSYPPEFAHQQVKRFGKIFSCSLFGKWVVVSADPTFNRFIMQNEGKLFGSKYPKSFRDLVGKNGVITVQGEQQRKLHGIASNLMRLDKLKFHFLKDIQLVMLQTLSKFHNNQVICLQDVCRKVAINLMVNQLLGVSSESEINEMAQLFSDFVDGCLSIPINFPGFTYYTAMKDEQDNLGTNCVGDELLTWQDYKAMPFTQCVIDETLRIGGIAIWLMREAKEDVLYQDYIIPKGCLVIPFLSAVHLDESLYKEALRFDPWRWMDPEYQEKRNWRNSPLYSPFGGGARFCPGAELARLQISLFLHYFVTTYRWTQVKGDQLSFFPSARLVNGFQIRLMRRHAESKLKCDNASNKSRTESVTDF